MYKVIGQSVDNNDFPVYIISQFSHIHIHIHTHIRLTENLPLMAIVGLRAVPGRCRPIVYSLNVSIDAPGRLTNNLTDNQVKMQQCPVYVTCLKHA